MAPRGDDGNFGGGGGDGTGRTIFCLSTIGDNCDGVNGFVTNRDFTEIRLSKKFGTSNIEWCSGIENIFRNSLKASIQYDMKKGAEKNEKKSHSPRRIYWAAAAAAQQLTWLIFTDGLFNNSLLTNTAHRQRWWWSKHICCSGAGLENCNCNRIFHDSVDVASSVLRHSTMENNYHCTIFILRRSI